LSKSQHGRLEHVSVSLDQCRDLLRQRRALRAAGLNPDAGSRPQLGDAPLSASTGTQLETSGVWICGPQIAAAGRLRSFDKGDHPDAEVGNGAGVSSARPCQMTCVK